MRFITDVMYEENSYVYCSFNLTSEGISKDYEVLGKILTVKEVANRPGEYEHRMQYEKINRDVREAIIKYIFEEERRIRRNTKR